jgi:hypothetical protein
VIVNEIVHVFTSEGTVEFIISFMMAASASAAVKIVAKRSSRWRRMESL